MNCAHVMGIIVNGIMDKQELLDLMSEVDDGVCYESRMFNEWIAKAGISKDGARKAIRGAKLGSACILTTLFPHAQEKDRSIIAIFMIEEYSEGSKEFEGYIKCNSRYHIQLSRDESELIKYWDYHKNEDNSIKWDSGLIRYIKDDEIIRILKDLYNLREHTRKGR